uniref:Gustatory receptor n=1 Tax=Phlebotomus papatasi TaxID=29031 RepID=A0A3F2ZEE3_PHLPP
MELVKLLKPLLVYLRIYGISLQTPDMTKKMRKFIMISAMINLIYLAIVPMVSSILFVIRKNLKMEDRSKIHFFIYCGNYIIHASVIFETFLTKEKQMNFWNTLLMIEQTFSKYRNFLGEANKCLSNKLYLRILVLSSLSMICKIIIWICNLQFKKSTDWYFIEIVTTLSQETGRLIFFSNFLFVEILRMHVKLYNDKTREISKMARKYNRKTLLNELNILKTRHSLIWKLNGLNSFLQWSLTLNFLHSFLHITYLLYWFYVVNTLRGLEYTLFGMFTFLVISIITLVHLVYSCEMLKQETQKTPPLIHVITQELSNPFDVDIHDSIMAISMQIQHEKIFITSAGFFKIDMALLTAIIATITTYLVIFIQFIG